MNTGIYRGVARYSLAAPVIEVQQGLIKASATTGQLAEERYA